MNREEAAVARLVSTLGIINAPVRVALSPDV